MAKETRPNPLKLPFWATFLTLMGVCILCALGTWQLQRLQWKTTLIDSYNAAPHVNTLSPSIADKPYLKAILRGYFIGDDKGHAQRFLVQPRTNKGKVGAHVYEPFLMESGKIIFVRLGWIAQENNGLPYTITFRHPYARTLDKRFIETIKGVTAFPPAPNIFTPENKENTLYYIDLENMAMRIGVQAEDVWPQIFWLAPESLQNMQDFTKTDETPPKNLPFYNHIKALPLQPSWKNNHLQYAFFWFAMAGTLISIYALRFLRRKTST
ncbi:MAG: SURF1 family protein [Rhodospirillales bacterium]|nr:SURF1 family protein [Alphaproteobacteria bacterium]MCB9981969.1 SURF1 family protein [Rhodospirillales bacterium]